MGETEGQLTEREIQAENRRKAVANMVGQLDKKDNFEGFKASVLAMYEQFGITHTADEGWAAEDERRWKMQYETWHTVSTRADIEIHGKELGDRKFEYANIYVHKLEINGIITPIRRVAPGACSLPGTETVSEGKYGRRVGDFYEQFEKDIGVHEATYLDKWLKADRGERRPGVNYFFIAVGDRFKRIPVKDWSLKLMERLYPSAYTRVSGKLVSDGGA